jgi:ApaG protein
MPSDTYNIEVEVETQYIEEQSVPDQDRYVFAYTITIHNSGKLPAKLLSRHWIVTDANNKIHEVKGEGVVGEQPHLQPGENFRYTSGTMLARFYALNPSHTALVDAMQRNRWWPVT